MYFATQLFISVLTFSNSDYTSYFELKNALQFEALFFFSLAKQTLVLDWLYIIWINNTLRYFKWLHLLGTKYTLRMQ